MSFCPSVINKGVGFYLPSLGEGLVGIMFFCPSVRYKMGYHVLLSGLRPEWGIDMSAPGNARGIGCRRDTPPKGAKQ